MSGARRPSATFCPHCNCFHSRDFRGCSYTAAAACDATAGCGWQNATAADLECPGSHVTGTCVAAGFTERNVYAIFGFCCKLAAFS